jgi:transcriptional regulator with XRE-family HTH domain
MKKESTELGLRRRIVGKFLRERRVKAGLTQMDVATSLSYTTAQFISNWERGISMPPLETLPKISGLLKIPPKEIIAVISQYQEQLLAQSRKELGDLFKKSR